MTKIYKIQRHLFQVFKTQKKILVLGLFIALLLSSWVEFTLIKSQVEHDNQQFEKVAENLQLSLNQFLHPLQGEASVYHIVHFKLSATDFKKYAAARNFFENFPGALGFGFIRKVDLNSFRKYQTEMKKERPDFAVHQVGKPLDTNQKEYFVIEVIEPLNPNKSAVGLDISSEKNRKEAAVQAMLTGKATITKKIQLVQVDKKEPGFLLLLPVYNDVKIPDTESLRIQNFIGWTYTPILANSLISFATDKLTTDLNFKIYQQNSSEQDNLLFKTDDRKSIVPFNFNWSKTIEIGGQKWILQGQRSNWLSPFHIHINSFFVFFTISLITILLITRLGHLDRDLKIKKVALETARKETEISMIKLESQKNFLNSMIDKLPAMIGYWDKNLINILANKEYTDFFGKTPEQISGRHIKDILGTEVYEKNLPYMLETLNGNRQDFERELKTQNGETKYMLASYIPDYLNKEVLGFFVIVFDITKLKQLENERQKIQTQLISSSKMSSLGEMAGGIAHEINNPLAIISGKAQQITFRIHNCNLEEKDKNKIELDLSKIESTVQRIAKIIKGLKSFSRDSASDPMQIVPLSQIIDETVELCKERFKNYGIELRMTHIEDCMLECQPTQISQVLMNLLSNAHDAVSSLPEKWVEVKAQRKLDQLELKVIDSGSGIAEHFVEKMMNPFFTTKEVGKGTGLGLCISMGIASKHNGELKYELDQNHTSFVLKLPINQNIQVKEASAV